MDYQEVKQDLRRSYDAEAAARAGMDDAPWKAGERVRFAGRLRESGAATLLEIGAGHGVSGRFFADEGFKVTCVDLSPELVARCRANGLDAQVMDFSGFPAGSRGLQPWEECGAIARSRSCGAGLGAVERCGHPGRF